jgi:hypothetical protein
MIIEKYLSFDEENGNYFMCRERNNEILVIFILFSDKYFL